MQEKPATTYPVGTRVTMREIGQTTGFYNEVGTVVDVGDMETTVRFTRTLTVNGAIADRSVDYTSLHRLWVSLEDLEAEQHDTVGDEG